MVKAGLIVGAAMLVGALALSLLSPLCTICGAIFAGLLAGYLANVFEKPVNAEGLIQRGAFAGAIAGAVAIVGQFIGAFINASSLDIATIEDMLGQPTGLTQESLWIFQLGGALCIGLLNIGLMAGLGAAGALLWKQMKGNNLPPSDLPPAPPVYTQ